MTPAGGTGGGLGSTGGSASGGTAAGPSSTTGGNTSAGEAASGGGTASTGGASTGGVSSTGGVTGSGGSSTGGAVGTGGTEASGGAIATGGAEATGGAGGQPSYKGVADSACADLPRLGVTWYYNWTTSPGSCQSEAEFVPMITRKGGMTASEVASAVTQVKNAGYTTVLGLNEPNKSDQANMSVSQVVAVWPSMTSDPALRVGSPSVSADARSWFEDFMDQVTANSLRVDFVTIHWYGWNAGSCDNANELENHIKWAEGFGLPIWLTEWGCMNKSNTSEAQVAAFFSAAVAMFENHPLLERYAFYPWNTYNHLVDEESGALTAVGTAFAAAEAYK